MVKELYESDDKMLSHPSHYQSKNGIEVIDVIEAFTEGLHGIEATDTGNIIKYACRWKGKNGIQDLEKILWYTTHLINTLKSNTESESTTQNSNADVGYTEIYIPKTHLKKLDNSDIGPLSEIPIAHARETDDGAYFTIPKSLSSRMLDLIYGDKTPRC